MENILIDKIRISGFRGLKDFEMTLSKTTVLTGMNNTGKTTILKALQLALGSRTFLSTDDLRLSQGGNFDNIIVVDVRIVPINSGGKIQRNFNEKWEEFFGTLIKPSENESYVPIRTELKYNPLKSSFDLKQTILNEWDNTSGGKWQDIISKKEKIDLISLPFFYIEAQRDIVEDLKLKTSFLGKMLSDVSKAYNEKDIEALEELIAELNEQTIAKSDILSTIQDTLEGINSTMDKKGSNVSISPFAKKIRDLNKSVSIHYGEKKVVLQWIIMEWGLEVGHLF
jgi:putative ATP-dependent endonuclease of OLD family